MLKGQYETQDATESPAKYIVVDTLENYKGLEPLVILFIIPQSWDSGYVESVKHQVYVATKTISGVEFLLPWEPSQNERDLAEAVSIHYHAVYTVILVKCWRGVCMV